jgi:HK97 family phage portal protein
MFGLGDVEASEDVFNEHLNRNKWGEKFWKNGAAPSGLLVCEESPNDKAEWELLKKQWQKEYGGVENSGKTAWLSGKWSYHQLGLSAVELQDIEKLKLNVEQIFAVHGVPLSVAGVRDAANFATARIDDIRFRRYTVKPLVRTIEAAINRGLAPGYGAVNVRFNVVGLSNTGEIIADFAPLFDRGGISINELRERAGLVRLDEPLFDQYFINAGLVPLDLAGVADMGATNQTAKNIVERFVRDGLRSGIRDGDAKP